MIATIHSGRRTFVRYSLACLALCAVPISALAVADEDKALKAAMAMGAARGAKMKVSAPVETPKIIAVRIRHDMCPFCKGFDPQFAKLVQQMKSKSVLFVTLDLSTPTTQEQAALLVGAMGLEEVWTGDLSKMGTMLFVDGKTKKTRSLTYQVDLKTVLAALRKELE